MPSMRLQRTTFKKLGKWAKKNVLALHFCRLLYIFLLSAGKQQPPDQFADIRNSRVPASQAGATLACTNPKKPRNIPGYDGADDLHKLPPLRAKY
jgi:hypothetical protein